MPLDRPEWFGRLERVAFGRSVRWAAAHAARIVANSDATASAVSGTLGVAPSSITVVPLGIDPAFFEPPDTAAIERTCRRYELQPGRYVAIVGRVRTRKKRGRSSSTDSPVCVPAVRTSISIS